MALKQLKVAPTKSALLNLQKQVRFLENGHDLLERKRELLTRLVYERVHEYEALREETHQAIKKAYHWLSVAQLKMGSRVLQQVGLGTSATLQVDILPKRNMGVEYPAVVTSRKPMDPIGLLGTDYSLDETRQDLTQAALLLAKLGQAEIALGRLMTEQKRTQKRVNALRYNVIPRYRNTIKSIQSKLEEDERSMLFQIKLLREKKPSASGN